MYEYDAAVRLSKETSYTATGVAVKSISYSYDLDGKRTRKVSNLGTQDYVYNANGQLATAGVNGYGYDVDGRLSTVTKAGGTVTLSHDAYDHLTQVTSNGVTTQYRYDANGNRIGEVSGSNAKNYLVAPNLGNGLASTDLVTDGSGNVVSDYVYGGSSIIARLDANGDPLYYLTDSMGSVIGLVDGDGNIQSRIVYDGFGNVESGDEGSSLGGDLRFQGQWLESESGLYYMRARNYDSETGLFLSRDAVDVQEQGVEAFNPYQFAFNNPLVYSDPTGMFSILELNAVMDTQNALQALKTYSSQQAKQYFQQKLGEALGNAFTNIVKRILPLGNLPFDDLPKKFQDGTKFENFLKGQICGVFNAVGGPFFDRLWIEPYVGSNGIPNAPGVNCQSTFNKIKPLKGKGSKPDFIFKDGEPTIYSPNDPKSFLIGDVKLTYKKALGEVTGLGTTKGNPSNQWVAIRAYASQYELSRMALYLTFRRDSKGDLLSTQNEIASIAQASKNALSKGVILIIARLSD